MRYVTFLKLVDSLGLYPWARAFRMWMDRHTPEGRRRASALKAFYSRFIRSNDLCFDIGANVGDRAAVFRTLGARVVCAEPQADCVAVLRRRFRRDPAVTVLPKAVGEREGVAELKACTYNPGISSLSDRWVSESRYAREYDWDRKVQVPVTTLDLLIAEHGVPRFCKIDVEGFEESVLRGLTRPLVYLSFEFRGEFMDEIGRCMEQILRVGPASFNCTVTDSETMLCADWVPAAQLRERLAALNDPKTWGDVYVRFAGAEPGA